ncbi:hypothetical protein FACS1894170_11860 [Planctomycetales bacterium]|nr:hypothetical protein FACS1894170_11860 [Planctomycetales bacterium]
MPQYITVDWDETECRYIVAGVHKERLSVEHYGCIPFANTVSDNDDAVQPDISTLLSTTVKKICDDLKLGNIPAVLTLGRAETNWIYQKLPNCSNAEIPVLLKNQVMRELPNFADFDPLDYLILDRSANSCELLALTIQLTHRLNLTKRFRNVHHLIQSIGSRAVDAAEVISANENLLQDEESAASLIVNVTPSEADLIIFADKQIRSIRSFRLPAADSAADNRRQTIADEIQRTLTVGFDNTELAIQRIIFFDDTLAGNFADSELDILVVNPFESLTKNVPKESAGKFAPLIGSLLRLRQKTLHPKTLSGIDFLHPKEAPKPPNYVRPAILAALFLGIIGYGLYYWNHGVIAGLETKLADIKKEHQKVSDELKAISPSWNVLRQTQIWETQNVLWLDVLKDLSQILPSGTDLVVSQMSCVTGPANNNPRIRGTVTLSGMVRDPSVLRKMQSDLQATGKYNMVSPAPAANPATAPQECLNVFHFVLL